MNVMTKSATLSRVLAVSTFALALASGTAMADPALTREQVRAEFVRAQAAGELPAGFAAVTPKQVFGTAPRSGKLGHSQAVSNQAEPATGATATREAAPAAAAQGNASSVHDAARVDPRAAESADMSTQTSGFAAKSPREIFHEQDRI